MRHPELAILSHHTTIFTTDKRFAVHLFPRSGVVELRIHKVNKGQIKKVLKKASKEKWKRGQDLSVQSIFIRFGYCVTKYKFWLTYKIYFKLIL